MLENLDFISSSQCLSSLSLSDTYLKEWWLHEEVKFFLPSPKQLGALESSIYEVSQSISVKWIPFPADLQSILHFCYMPVVGRWWKAWQLLLQASCQVQRSSFWKTGCEKGRSREALGRCFPHKPPPSSWFDMEVFISQPKFQCLYLQST